MGCNCGDNNDPTAEELSSQDGPSEISNCSCGTPLPGGCSCKRKAPNLCDQELAITSGSGGECDTTDPSLVEIDSSASTIDCCPPEPCVKKPIKTVCAPAVVQTPQCPSPGCEVPIVPAQPYYRNVSLSPQDNRQYVYKSSFSSVLKTRGIFNMPSCGNRADIFFENLEAIGLGSVLWANGVGYLTVVAFDNRTGKVVVRNDCPTGCDQALPGEQIGSCTYFTVTAPSCSNDTVPGPDDGPFLAAGFTAPPVDGCIDILVTTSIGLQVSKAVSIYGGTYVVDDIKSNSLVTICNEGEGVTPGTGVPYLDADGAYITPVTPLDINPCSDDGVSSGKIVVCKDGVQHVLIGTNDLQVPVLDSVTGEVEFRDLLLPIGTCTSLTASITLDPGLPPGTSYIAIVGSTDGFTGGDLINLDSQQFTIDTVDTATQLHITPVVDPVVIHVIPVGASLCLVDCCVSLQHQIDDFDAMHLDDQITSGNGTVINATESYTGDTLTVTFVNGSTIKDMKAQLGLSTNIQGVVAGLSGGSYRIELQYELDGGTTELIQTDWFFNQVSTNQGAQVIKNLAMSIPPSTSVVVTCRGKLQWLGSTGAMTYTIDYVTTEAKGIGVAV